MAYSSAAAPAKIKHEAGTWYPETKDRRKAEVESPILSPLDRIHSCLVLNSAPFHTELVRLTPAQICDRADVDPRHFRRYIAQLEAEGFVRIEGRTKGKIRIYSCAHPDEHKKSPRASASVRSCGPRAERLSHRGRQSASPFSDAALAAMKRHKSVVPPDCVISPDMTELLESINRRSILVANEDALLGADLRKLKSIVAARGDNEPAEGGPGDDPIVAARGDNEPAEGGPGDDPIVAARITNCHRAESPNNKEQKNKETSSSSDQLAAATTTEVSRDARPDARRRGKAASDTRIAPDPANGRNPAQSAEVRQTPRSERLDGRRAGSEHGDEKPHRDADRPDGAHLADKQPRAQEPRDARLCAPVVVAAIAAVLGAPDEAFQCSFMAECRKVAPDVTDDELARHVKRKAGAARGKEMPFAYLRASVVASLKSIDVRAAQKPRELPPPEPFAPEEAEYFRRRNALEAAGDQEGVRVLDAYWDTHGKLPDKLK